MVRVIEAIYGNPKFSVKEMGNIIRKKTELGNQTRMPTIPLLFYDSNDCNDERHKPQSHTRRKVYS